MGNASGWGKAHHNTHSSYGARYTTGDAIEISVAMDTLELSLALNGQHFAVAYSNLTKEGIRPAVTLHHVGDCVSLRRCSSLE